MWARHFEFVLGIWLLFSWIIFRYTSEENFLMIQDYILGSLLILFSLGSYLKKFKRLHLLNLCVAFWLLGFVFINSTTTEYPPYQNYMVIGLLLLMISVIPSHCNQPPDEWIEFIKE